MWRLRLPQVSPIIHGLRGPGKAVVFNPSFRWESTWERLPDLRITMLEMPRTNQIALNRSRHVTALIVLVCPAEGRMMSTIDPYEMWTDLPLARQSVV